MLTALAITKAGMAIIIKAAFVAGVYDKVYEVSGKAGRAMKDSAKRINAAKENISDEDMNEYC